MKMLSYTIMTYSRIVVYSSDVADDWRLLVSSAKVFASELFVLLDKVASSCYNESFGRVQGSLIKTNKRPT